MSMSGELPVFNNYHAATKVICLYISFILHIDLPHELNRLTLFHVVQYGNIFGWLTLCFGAK